jgi:hypothetical protein
MIDFIFHLAARHGDHRRGHAADPRRLPDRPRIKVAGPNEAYIITGRKGSPVKNPETGEVSTT